MPNLADELKLLFPLPPSRILHAFKLVLPWRNPPSRSTAVNGGATLLPPPPTNNPPHFPTPPPLLTNSLSTPPPPHAVHETPLLPPLPSPPITTLPGKLKFLGSSPQQAGETPATTSAPPLARGPPLPLPPPATAIFSGELLMTITSPTLLPEIFRALLIIHATTML